MDLCKGGGLNLLGSFTLKIPSYSWVKFADFFIKFDFLGKQACCILAYVLQQTNRQLDSGRVIAMLSASNNNVHTDNQKGN